MTTDVELGARLGGLVRERRALLGLTLEQLAARTGCTKSHLWDIERGKSRNPTLATLIGLAEAFGTTPVGLMAELYEGAPPALADPDLARLSLALVEVGRLLPKLERLKRSDADG